MKDHGGCIKSGPNSLLKQIQLQLASSFRDHVKWFEHTIYEPQKVFGTSLNQQGVSTLFYNLDTMVLTSRGTPRDYSPLHHIKAVKNMFYDVLCCYRLTSSCKPSHRQVPLSHLKWKWSEIRNIKSQGVKRPAKQRLSSQLSKFTCGHPFEHWMNRQRGRIPAWKNQGFWNLSES